MRPWSHSCSLDWLKARREVLTATEAISLLPENRKWDGASIMPNCAGLWGTKTSSEELDPMSLSWAARGHILEPYALAQYRSISGDDIFWYDDLIITGNIGFSPDGLSCNIPLKPNEVRIESNDKRFANNIDVTAYEVKCYAAKKHTQKILENKMKHEERYQVAWAMLCCLNITKAELIFFNPSAAIPIHHVSYTRFELDKEIKELSKVSEMYETTKMMLDAISKTTEPYDGPSEEEIWKENQAFVIDL